MEILQFMFSSFWIWLGAVILILAACDLVIAFGKAIGYAVHGVRADKS